MASSKLKDTKTPSLFTASKSQCHTSEPFVPGPNPRLPKFVQQHTTPYHPTSDKYDVGPFSKDIVVDKAASPKAIYDMHTYWSKKHWAAIREYIRHYLPTKYYPKGTGLVLDCFSGSGMTGVAAMMEGRPCVLIDASPAAAFISHCYTHPAPPDELQAAYERMMSEPYPDDLKRKLKKVTGEDIETLQHELDWLYATKCDRCGGAARTEYVVYSQRFQCPNCGQLVALLDCPVAMVPYEVGSKKSPKAIEKEQNVCPHCLKKYGKPRKDFAISTRAKKFGSVPVLVNYECLGDCKPSRGTRRHGDPRSMRKGRFFEEYDLAKLAAIEKATIPHWYPDRKMMDVQDDSKPWGVKWRAGSANFRSVQELYSPRNFWGLAAVKAGIERSPQKDALALIITASCMWLSKMNRHRPESSFKSGIVNGTYYVPQISQDQSVAYSLPGKFATIVRSQEALWDTIGEMAGTAIVMNQDARFDKGLEHSSVDFIFTDPPYLNVEAQYGELNFIWESWLNCSSKWLSDEVIVNPVRGKTVNDWDRDMRAILARCYALLKPGRWAAVCYHEVSPHAWKMLQNALLDIGFEISTVTAFEPIQKTFKMQTMEKVVKGDLVLNCFKPRLAGVKDSNADQGLVNNRVRDILVETLSTVGGQTRDRLWDIVLKRLLTRGQMAEHRFDDLLAQVAVGAEGGRWFLKDEFQQWSEDDLKNEEHAGEALMRFVRLRCAGVSAKHAATIASEQLSLTNIDNRGRLDEKGIEDWINEHVKMDDRTSLAKHRGKRVELGGRLAGIEFYDALFFYLTKYMKNRRADQLPKRNLAEFLEEYVVRFPDGDKWLYRAPTSGEADEMQKARQSGLGRRIRGFANALRDGDRAYINKHRPDVKTFVEWMRYCASFGRYEDGAALYDLAGFKADQLERVIVDEKEEETARDAVHGFGELCKRRLKKDEAEEDDDTEDADESKSVAR